MSTSDKSKANELLRGVDLPSWRNRATLYSCTELFSTGLEDSIRFRFRLVVMRCDVQQCDAIRWDPIEVGLRRYEAEGRTCGPRQHVVSILAVKGHLNQGNN